MRILLVTQYFWPENFKINDLVLGLKEKNCEVIILTGKPNYPFGKYFEGYSFFGRSREEWNGMKIYRCPLISRRKGTGVHLFLNYLSFVIFASLRALTIKEKVDKILVYEPSPITVGIPAILLKRIKKAPIFFWVQDLWPQSVTAAGKMKRKWIMGALNRLTKWIYKHSDVILVQSRAFKSFIIRQGVPAEKIIYYPNSTESFYNVAQQGNHPEITKLIPEGFNIAFAGNLGEAQDFDTILEAAAALEKTGEKINWLIIGDGRKKEYILDKAREYGLQRFHLLGYFPSESMPLFFAYADALFVSLRKDFIFSLTIPSKIQSYLACGKPIISALDGEGSEVIREAGAGFTGASGDARAIVDNILKLYYLPVAERKEMGRNARKYFNENFERELLLNKLINILSSNTLKP